MFFKHNNINIYYEKYGTKNNDILILPGWGNTRQTFYNIINHFKDNHTIYIFDYPGFGNSPIPKKTLTIYNYADIIKTFIEKNNITNPTIIAHSFGGRITTLLAGYYKLKINKLILIDIASIKPKKTIKQKLKEKTYKLLKKIIKLLPNNKTLLQRLINLFGSSDYKNLQKSMQQTFINIVNEDLSKYLNNIETESLIIWGEEDIDTPLKDAHKINKSIKNSALIIYPKANHYSYLQHPILTNNIISEFIKEKTT